MDERKVIFSLTKPQDLSFDPDRSEEEAKESNLKLGNSSPHRVNYLSPIFTIMKTLRMIGMAFVAVLMCVNFAACGSGDDEPETNEEGVVINEKKLIEIKMAYDDDDDDNCETYFNYDSKGRLIYKKDGATGDTYYTWEDNAIVAKHSGWTQIHNLNSKNLVENVEETGSFTCFAYDLNNQLVKFERNGSATDFSWENGKICKSIYKDDHSEIISIFTYQGTCKGYFPPYSTYYIDSDDYEISLAHPELIGLRCSQLPSRITRQTDSGEHILNFSYNFDSDGYIETCTINEFSVFNGNPNSWTCTWNFKWQ